MPTITPALDSGDAINAHMREVALQLCGALIMPANRDLALALLNWNGKYTDFVAMTVESIKSSQPETWWNFFLSRLDWLNEGVCLNAEQSNRWLAIEGALGMGDLSGAAAGSVFYLTRNALRIAAEKGLLNELPSNQRTALESGAQTAET